MPTINFVTNVSAKQFAHPTFTLFLYQSTT